MQILKILDDDQLRFTQNLLAEINFKDGKESAKGLAKQVKNNKEASKFGEEYEKISKYLYKILTESNWLRRRYVPKRFSNLIINKYSNGENYGRHFDSSHMQTKSGSVRSDLSFTLMLSNASDYEGGELEIEAGNQTHKVSLDAGYMVIYPSIFMHSVLPVVHGDRIACVGWFSSHIKDSFARETLNEYEEMHLSLLKYDLSEADQLKLAYVQNRIRHLLSN
jgi:PKHD-type hydroxylase